MSKTACFCCGIIVAILIGIAEHAFIECSQYTKGQINAFQHVKYHCEGD